ncbi:MFS transporter [Sphingomonas sp. FW199]|uniref:MFS transporter n=1 Tax=Sphingomonas sp. FW199 TaxID=3400217 RepID=UPI003CFA5E7D
MAPPPPTRHPARSILFGSGDFGFNLYWQALSLFLLFFYTDRLGLSPEVAGSVMAAGAVMDGAADLAIGIAVDRWRIRYRRVVAIMALPLGLSFILIFAEGLGGGIGTILAAHLLFRLLYAVVNLPYAAWSVRVSHASADRTLMSGARMAFGAASAVTVALAMPGLGNGYTGTAILFAGAATAILLIVALFVPEQQIETQSAGPRSVRRDLMTLIGNRAFITLTLAALAATVAGAIIGHSVLYFFTHSLAAPEAGQQALAMMGVVGAVTVPPWTALALRMGARATWLGAAALGIVAAALFALVPGVGVTAALLFLGAMQTALSGFHLSAWAMLPDAVDHGADATGHRVEATAFSVFMLAQKLGLGLAALLLGAVYAAWGYRGGTPGPAARDAIQWLMIAGPAIAVALGAGAMLGNPLRGRQASVNSPDTPSA